MLVCLLKWVVSWVLLSCIYLFDVNKIYVGSIEWFFEFMVVDIFVCMFFVGIDDIIVIVFGVIVSVVDIVFELSGFVILVGRFISFLGVSLIISEIEGFEVYGFEGDIVS